MDVGFGSDLCRSRMVGGVGRKGGWSGEGCAYQCDRTKDIGPDQCAPSRDRSAKIVADNSRNRTMAERQHQCQRVPDRIQYAERMQVAVVIGTPAGRAAIAPLVG